MCSASEAGSNSRRIDFVYHSILGLRVIKKRREVHRVGPSPFIGRRRGRVGREREARDKQEALLALRHARPQTLGYIGGM